MKDLVDTTDPQHKYVVIDELPNKSRATYCIHTPEGWVVFSRYYTEGNIVYPSIYGILFRKLDIDTFSEASVHGMSIDDIDNILKDIIK